MNAFISWSGSRELLIAKAVKKWLSAVVPEIESFVSPDLQKGKPWFAELGTKGMKTPYAQELASAPAAMNRPGS